ncbi:MAG: hypothetical protein KatS3mg114_1466 [Planctomycetaceae bacterium]|nr:MAG: hypothetical protein KatS3mg114_1466 [Planctomycetaceae bacterium]
MPRRWIDELKDGELVEEVYAVADRQVRANRQATLYLSLDLRDRTGTINARLWNVSSQIGEQIQPGDYVWVRGKVQVYQGNLQLILTHLRPVAAESLNREDFEPQPTHDVEQLWNMLCNLLAQIQRPELQALAHAVLDDPGLAQPLKLWPAGVKAHHNVRGGLLAHLVAMAQLVLKICEVYPRLDRDLLLCGVLFHDLGKLRELSYEPQFQYTDEGQLVGHLVQGIELLAEKLRDLHTQGIVIPPALTAQLKHLIVSHHGSVEHGSPKLPMTPEALVLHLIDHLDAKLDEFYQALDGDPHPQASWTLYLPRLERKLYKGPQRDAASSRETT